MMRKVSLIYVPIAAVLFGLYLVFTGAPAGHGHGGELEKANIDLADQEALQRGAKWFINYCSGCHSMEYFRFERMQDFGLTEDEIRDNFMFAGGKIGDQIKIAMPSKDAKDWFGAAAPDLTLTGRLRDPGADWIYSYLKGFYRDPSRPMGVNNVVFPNVGMPHILWELQGWQDPVWQYDVMEHGHAVASFETKEEADAFVEEKGGEHGEEMDVTKVLHELKLTEKGTMDEAEYDAMARDLATFMVHVAEPVRLERQRLGMWVILFLVVFAALAYVLKKEFWRDVH